MLALAMRERERYVTSQARRKSLEDAVKGYLEWAVTHPHEYRLIYGSNWARVLSVESGRPGLKWVREQFAKEHGGKPEEYDGVTSMLWLLLHGAAHLLSQESAGASADYVREKTLSACGQIITRANRLRG